MILCVLTGDIEHSADFFKWMVGQNPSAMGMYITGTMDQYCTVHFLAWTFLKGEYGASSWEVSRLGSKTVLFTYFGI